MECQNGNWIGLGKFKELLGAGRKLPVSFIIENICLSSVLFKTPIGSEFCSMPREAVAMR